MNKSFEQMLLSLPAILIALSFHEFAHGKAADLLGDPTPGDQGRLTLNPLPHIDWLGFFMLLFASFGWAKPVLVSPWKFTRKVTMKTGMMIVALAGPAMNFFLAVVATVILGLFDSFIIFDFPAKYALRYMISYLIWINIILGLFNLIPIPPLDGSKILAGLLPDKGSNLIYSLERYGPILLIILIFSGVFGKVIGPFAKVIYDTLLSLTILF